MVPGVGVLGAVASTMRVTVPVAELPAVSVMVMTGLLPMLFPVPVHVIVPPVDGEGVQVVPGIEMVAPDSTLVVVEIVTSVVAVAGDGEATVDGTDGALSSRVRDGVRAPVFWFPAGSVTVMVCGVPSNCQTPVPAVAVQVTIPLAVAGDGVQLMFGIERVEPDSTLEI